MQRVREALGVPDVPGRAALVGLLAVVGGGALGLLADSSLGPHALVLPLVFDLVALDRRRPLAMAHYVSQYGQPVRPIQALATRASGDAETAPTASAAVLGRIAARRVARAMWRAETRRGTCWAVASLTAFLGSLALSGGWDDRADGLVFVGGCVLLMTAISSTSANGDTSRRSTERSGLAVAQESDDASAPRARAAIWGVAVVGAVLAGALTDGRGWILLAPLAGLILDGAFPTIRRRWPRKHAADDATPGAPAAEGVPPEPSDPAWDPPAVHAPRRLCLGGTAAVLGFAAARLTKSAPFAPLWVDALVLLALTSAVGVHALRNARYLARRSQA